MIFTRNMTDYVGKWFSTEFGMKFVITGFVSSDRNDEFVRTSVIMLKSAKRGIHTWFYMKPGEESNYKEASATEEDEKLAIVAIFATKLS